MAAMSTKKVKAVQHAMNLYLDYRGWLGLKPLKLDGKLGPTTRRYIRYCKWFLGFHPDHAKHGNITSTFVKLITNPKSQTKAGQKAAKSRQAARKRKLVRQKKARSGRKLSAWQGSLAMAERAIGAGRRAGVPVTSRKRHWSHPLSRSNPDSDHNTANKGSYALDFGTFSGARLAHMIARVFGIKNYNTGNYNFYYVRWMGRTFRIQILWAVAGHYNHVHLGVRRVS